MAVRTVLMMLAVTVLLGILATQFGMKRGEAVSESVVPSQSTATLQAVSESSRRELMPPDGTEALPAPPEPPAAQMQATAAPASEYRFPTAFEERVRTPVEVFEAMYGAMTLSELAAQKGMVEVEYFELLNQRSEERFAAGLYEEYVTERPSDPQGEMDLPEWPPHHNLVKGQRTSERPDGRVAVQRIVLPSVEHPDLYWKNDELGWLNVRISQLMKEEAQAGEK